MDDPRLGDGVREIKLIRETSSGNRIRVPATIDIVNGRIEFLKSPFALKDEIKADRKSTRLNSSHIPLSRMPSSA